MGGDGKKPAHTKSCRIIAGGHKIQLHLCMTSWEKSERGRARARSQGDRRSIPAINALCIPDAVDTHTHTYTQRQESMVRQH